MKSLFKRGSLRKQAPETNTPTMSRFTIRKCLKCGTTTTPGGRLGPGRSPVYRTPKGDELELDPSRDALIAPCRACGKKNYAERVGEV